jgi:hypothetical protein
MNFNWTQSSPAPRLAEQKGPRYKEWEKLFPLIAAGLLQRASGELFR